MKTLDLHGVKHHKAENLVRLFLNFAQLPCQIITGNSPEMKKIVRSVVEEFQWSCYEKDNYNYGTLIINERS
tara:strand:+ start:1773 stop:1988 length:216 start_codon:yes stop_codon:yes gene_type:complete